jgi:6,7-dimethyl-8-ribityllumazine synthase
MQQQQNLKTVSKLPDLKVAILHTEYYSEHVKSLVSKCVDTFNEFTCHDIDIYCAPGCIELPLYARRLAHLKKRYEVIICFGIIIKGDSYHFDVVLNSVVSGLNQVMLEEDLPLINMIIPADNLDIVKARSANDNLNKGIEAATTALKVAAWRRTYRP